MRSLRFPLFALSLAITAACGGKVLVDPGIGNGGGGAGGSTSTGTTQPVDAGSGGPEYSARMLATNLQRYVIFKVDKSLDRCVRVMVANAASGLYPNIQTTMGWSVESAEVTAHASDCALGPNGFPIMTMQKAQASDGGGDLKQDSPSFPNVVTIHVKLSFPAGAPWVPPGDTLDADNLQIIQGPLGGP